MSQVALVKCQSYDDSTCRTAVSQALSLIGGIESYVSPGQKVFLKVNLLLPAAPERGVTTHPGVVRAIAELIIAMGARPIIGDCPGYPMNDAALKMMYRATGLLQVAESTGAELNFDAAEVVVPFPDGTVLKSLVASRAMIEADALINLPKMKTHGYTTMTGAVKNLFGVIPGIRKADYHFKMPDARLFGSLLVDIARAVPPVLNVMDAVEAMEGAGPTHGDIVDTGLILASPDPFALDMVMSVLMGITDPRQVGTLLAAMETGVGPRGISEVEVLGEDPSLVARKFILPDSATPNPLTRALPSWLSSGIARAIRPKPVFDKTQCTGCATCQQHCPAGAISMKDGVPEVELGECIRCFCCQELCPSGAVHIIRPPLGRMLFR